MSCSTASSSPLNTVVLVYSAFFLLSSPASLSFSVFSYFTFQFVGFSHTTFCNVSTFCIFIHPMMSLPCPPFSSTLSHSPFLHCLTFIASETFFVLYWTLYLYILIYLLTVPFLLSKCLNARPVLDQLWIWSLCTDCLFFPNELHCTLIEGFLLLFSNPNISYYRPPRVK